MVPQSGLFMCPCHGGVYYANGGRGLWPATARLVRIRLQVENGRLVIKAGQVPRSRNRRVSLCGSTKEVRMRLIMISVSGSTTACS